MSIPFGKKIQCGNYYIMKHSRSLSKSELKELRRKQGIPADVQKHLQRASLPYIKVSTCTDSWSIEFVIGMKMFELLDSVHFVYDGDGSRLLYGDEKNAYEHMFVQMVTDTTLIGDVEYRKGKMKLQKEYLERESERLNAAEDAGKSEEQLREESDEAVQEVIDRDKHAATILEMGKQVAKEEAEKGGKR